MNEEEFLKIAREITQKLSEILLLQNFHPIEVEIKEKLEENAIAELNFSFPYKTIHINCSKDILKETKETIKDYLAHEMCHAITDPLYNSAFDRFITKPELQNRREELTDHIANIILKNKMI